MLAMLFQISLYSGNDDSYAFEIHIFYIISQRVTQHITIPFVPNVSEATLAPIKILWQTQQHTNVIQELKTSSNCVLIPGTISWVKKYLSCFLGLNQIDVRANQPQNSVVLCK